MWQWFANWLSALSQTFILKGSSFVHTLQGPHFQDGFSEDLFNSVTPAPCLIRLATRSYGFISKALKDNKLGFHRASPKTNFKHEN